MSYNKKTWISGETITKDSLNNIENGIANVEDEIDTRLDGLSHILITMADYEALSESQKNDPTVLYMITDAPSIDLSAVEVNTDHLLPKADFEAALETLVTETTFNDTVDLLLPREEFSLMIGDITSEIVEKEELNSRLDGLTLNALTEAEFEALSEEEQNREDVLYIINNGESSVPINVITKEDLDARLDGLIINALTEAEFEALSEEEQNREDVLYIIETTEDDTDQIEYDMDEFSLKNYLKNNLKLQLTNNTIDLVLEDEVISSINKDDIMN